MVRVAFAFSYTFMRALSMRRSSPLPLMLYMYSLGFGWITRTIMLYCHACIVLVPVYFNSSLPLT